MTSSTLKTSTALPARLPFHSFAGVYLSGLSAQDPHVLTRLDTTLDFLSGSIVPKGQHQGVVQDIESSVAALTSGGVTIPTEMQAKIDSTVGKLEGEHTASGNGADTASAKQTIAGAETKPGEGTAART